MRLIKWENCGPLYATFYCRFLSVYVRKYVAKDSWKISTYKNKKKRENDFRPCCWMNASYSCCRVNRRPIVLTEPLIRIVLPRCQSTVNEMFIFLYFHNDLKRIEAHTICNSGDYNTRVLSCQSILLKTEPSIVK